MEKSTLTLSFKKVQQDQSVTDNKASVYSTLTLDVFLHVLDAVLLGLLTHEDRGQHEGHPLEAGLGPGD